MAVLYQHECPDYWLPVSAPQYLESKALGKPKQTYEWELIPKIRVCTDSGVSISRTKQALSYWEKHGYEFGAIYGDPFSMCMTPKHGEILITIPDGTFDTNHMASTRLYTDTQSGKIVRAKIQMLPHNARKDRVLEHEIGHALGWAHYRQRYHIMHPKWRHGGYDSQGIRKR
jgi:hypothetical protein